MPGWAIHLAGKFAESTSIYRKSIAAETQVALLAKVRKITRQVSRRLDPDTPRGRYAVIQFSEQEAVVYSELKPKGQCSHYELRKHGDAVDNLFRTLAADTTVQAVELTSGKPISTARAWGRGEEVEPKHADAKLKRIGKAFEEAGFTLFTTTISAGDDTDEALAAIKRRNQFIERDAQCDFVAIVSADSKIVHVTSSKQVDASSIEVLATTATDDARDALSLMSKAVGDELWRSHLSTTPRWTPKATRGWSPLIDTDTGKPVEATTERFVEVCEAAGVKPKKLEHFEETAAQIKGAVAEFKPHQAALREKVEESLTSQRNADDTAKHDENDEKCRDSLLKGFQPIENLDTNDDFSRKSPSQLTFEGAGIGIEASLAATLPY